MVKKMSTSIRENSMVKKVSIREKDTDSEQTPDPVVGPKFDRTPSISR